MSRDHFWFCDKYFRLRIAPEYFAWASFDWLPSHFGGMLIGWRSCADVSLMTHRHPLRFLGSRCSKVLVAWSHGLAQSGEKAWSFGSWWILTKFGWLTQLIWSGAMSLEASFCSALPALLSVSCLSLSLVFDDSLSFQTDYLGIIRPKWNVLVESMQGLVVSDHHSRLV